MNRTRIRERIRDKNTSFSTSQETYRQAKALALLEGISLSELVDQAVCREVERLVKKHQQNQQLATLLLPQPIA